MGAGPGARRRRRPARRGRRLRTRVECSAAEEIFLPALRALARLREHTGELRGAAELWIREARQTKLAERAARAFRHAARLYANAIRDERSAAACLEEVLALDPDAEIDFQVL